MDAITLFRGSNGNIRVGTEDYPRGAIYIGIGRDGNMVTLRNVFSNQTIVQNRAYNLYINGDTGVAFTSVAALTDYVRGNAFVASSLTIDDVADLKNSVHSLNDKIASLINLLADPGQQKIKFDGTQIVKFEDTQKVTVTETPAPDKGGYNKFYSFVSQAGRNFTSAIPAACTVGLITVDNTTAVGYKTVIIYDKSATPADTDNPNNKLIIVVPAGGSKTISLPAGMRFINGLAFSVTAGIGLLNLASVAIGDVVININFV